MFRIELSKQASRFLRKCDKELRIRIIKKLKLLRTEPFPSDSKRLQNYNKPTSRVRVGKYRIIYEVNYDCKVILVSKIDKRSKVYD